jgi:hypothetical protein
MFGGETSADVWVVNQRVTVIEPPQRTIKQFVGTWTVIPFRPTLHAGIEWGTELEFVIMVIAVSCVKLLSAHNSTQHTSRKHKV